MMLIKLRSQSIDASPRQAKTGIAPRFASDSVR